MCEYGAKATQSIIPFVRTPRVTSDQAEISKRTLYGQRTIQPMTDVCGAVGVTIAIHRKSVCFPELSDCLATPRVNADYLK